MSKKSPFNPPSFAIFDNMEKLLPAVAQSVSENRESVPGWTVVRRKLCLNFLNLISCKVLTVSANHSYFQGMLEQTVQPEQFIVFPLTLPDVATRIPMPSYGAYFSISAMFFFRNRGVGVEWSNPISFLCFASCPETKKERESVTASSVISLCVFILSIPFNRCPVRLWPIH